jgi:23S rRNA (pseudouridine1915-N3)-methyltransferase
MARHYITQATHDRIAAEFFDLTTRELAGRFAALAGEAPDVALLIGGPDGHAPAVRSCAAEVWSLSKLTLPHGLARVLLVEPVYRAQSLLLGHPYHRD